MTQFDYCNMRISLPSRKEQDIIVSYIEDKCVAIDTVIEKKKKAIEKEHQKQHEAQKKLTEKENKKKVKK